MAKKVRGFIYKSYSFRDKDPVIDELRTVFQKEFRTISHKTLTTVQQDGGPTVSCMFNWFYGTTKRPQSATVEAAGRAAGHKRVWQRMK